MTMGGVLTSAKGIICFPSIGNEYYKYARSTS
ncbi:hypothetical protein [Pseudomonas sp. 31 R 17]|nr:hypothetical protein [Pseudomonas sp. 31 R 17]